MSARIDTAAERARLDALAGHTPGPWDCEIQDGRLSDCRLIAAAPDLLTGYRAALDEIDRLTAALAEAEARGAAQMRERAAQAVIDDPDCSPWEFADAIRALPLREPGAT